MPTQAVAVQNVSRPVEKSLREYARGIAGGLIFSLPLLYTMEVWWAGFVVHPLRLALYVTVTFGLLLLYNRYAGLRRDASWLEVAIDSVEELGIGLFLSALILWLLGRIGPQMPFNEIIGKIVIEALTVAIGVSVGTAQLGGQERDDEDKGMSGEEDDDLNFTGEVAIAFCGAVLFAANIAPTEEIVMIAAESSPWQLFGIALFSLTLGALILFYSEFVGAQRLAKRGGAVERALDAGLTYAIALLASALILWLFGRFEGASLNAGLAQTVVLGLAATLGSSAGRLLLQLTSSERASPAPINRRDRR